MPVATFHLAPQNDASFSVEMTTAGGELRTIPDFGSEHEAAVRGEDLPVLPRRAYRDYQATKAVVTRPALVPVAEDFQAGRDFARGGRQRSQTFVPGLMRWRRPLAVHKANISPESSRSPEPAQSSLPVLICAATIRPMCGRYTSFLPAVALARIFGTVNPLPNLAPTWNMAPTMDAPIVRQHANGERHLDVLKWGLLAYFTKDPKKARKPINARSETIAKSGMFRAAFAQRRCLVPAPAYYEWRDDPDGPCRWRSSRFRRDMGDVEIAGRRAAADLRNHHDRRQPAACRHPGPHAGDHRTEGLATMAGRERG
jgi:hypothetical protein